MDVSRILIDYWQSIENQEVNIEMLPVPLYFRNENL